MSFWSKVVAPVKAAGVLIGTTVDAVVREGREGVADSRIAAISAVRVAALTDPQNASGPVAIAGTIGYYTAGIPGAFVAGFCTSLGCALLSRLAPEKKDGSQ